jgi:hypothetical protein
MCLQVLGWTWDAERDRIFHKRVLHTNAPYLDWMKKIKNATTFFDVFVLQIRLPAHRSLTRH